MPKYYFYSYNGRDEFKDIVSAPNPMAGIQKSLARSHPSDFTKLGPIIGWNEIGFESYMGNFLYTEETLIELGYL